MGAWQVGALMQKKNVFIWLQHLISESQELERGPWAGRSLTPLPRGVSSDTSWASETQGCLTHLCQFFDSGGVGEEIVQGVSGRSVKGTRAPAIMAAEHSWSFFALQAPNSPYCTRSSRIFQTCCPHLQRVF